MTPAVLGGKTLLAGTIGGVSGLLLQLATEADHVSLAGIAAGFATGASVLLFGMFIKQGNRLAAVDAREEERNRNVQRDLARLDLDSRTVDARITASKHGLRNEVTPLLANVEDRLMVRMDENTRALTRAEERLNHFLEEHTNVGKRRTQ